MDSALHRLRDAQTLSSQAQVDSLVNANGKYISLMTSPQGSVLAKITKKNAPVEVYSYDEVNYELKPSTKTINGERAKLEKFLEGNTSAKAFAENAAKAKLLSAGSQPFFLFSGSSAHGRSSEIYYPDSRQVVRWVMIDGKPGEVSHIYESKDALTPGSVCSSRSQRI